MTTRIIAFLLAVFCFAGANVGNKAIANWMKKYEKIQKIDRTQ